MAQLSVTHVMPLSEDPGRVAFSGAENHLWILLPALKDAGLDVEFCAAIRRPGPTIDAKLEELTSQGVTTVKSPSISGSWPERVAAYRYLYSFLRARRSSIVHAHLSVRWLLPLTRLAGCRHVIFSVHNDEPAYGTPKARALFRFLNGGIARYIAISDRVRDYFLSVSGASEEKVETIRYGYRLPQGVPARSKEELRKAFDVPTDRFIIGFVGRLDPQKNLPLLVETIKGLSFAHGVVIGGGSEEAALKGLAKKNGADNISFLGPLPDAADLMPMFDVFCLPSTWEGLGLVLLEAMFRDVPIIGSRAGAIPEILDNGNYGLLFQSGDAEGLRRAIIRAYEDPEALARLALSARLYAEKNFQVETMIKKTIEVYKAVLAEGGVTTGTTNLHGESTCRPG